MSGETVSVREATAADREFVLETCRRFADSEGPGFRTSQEIVEGEARTLRAYFAGQAPRSTLLVARIGDERAGFAYLEELVDYFTQRRHGHVGMLAVTAAAEGHGVARALLAAAEAWARGRGFASLTLSAFEGNTRARRLYERWGFATDTIRYSKTL